MEQRLKRLDNTQLSSFDGKVVYDKQWYVQQACIERSFPSGDFTFLDVGGGNGRFADKLLDSYPAAKGTVIDNSEYLISKNKALPRKRALFLSADEITATALSGEKFDLIVLNNLLHHLVAKSYAGSLRAIGRTLSTIASLMTERGRISIWEPVYNGALVDSLASRTIYFLTSRKSISRITKFFGANTAGVGVCFLSKKQWLGVFQRAGLQVEDYTYWAGSAKQSLLKEVMLHIGDSGATHFWLARNPLYDRMPVTRRVTAEE